MVFKDDGYPFFFISLITRNLNFVYFILRISYFPFINLIIIHKYFFTKPKKFYLLHDFIFSGSIILSENIITRRVHKSQGLR